MRLVDRDYQILKEIGRWHVVLGRHIKELIKFSGVRACDRRLKILLDNDYVSRKKILYGVPYLYSLTHKGRLLLGQNKREDKIRLERIMHDIYVLDTVIYLSNVFKVPLQNFESEKELHVKDGFGTRKHQPDFVFYANSKTPIAVEIELSQKSKTTLEKNIRDNYMTYAYQFWLSDDKKVIALIENLAKEYANIKLMELGVIKNVKH